MKRCCRRLWLRHLNPPVSLPDLSCLCTASAHLRFATRTPNNQAHSKQMRRKHGPPFCHLLHHNPSLFQAAQRARNALRNRSRSIHHLHARTHAKLYLMYERALLKFPYLFTTFKQRKQQPLSRSTGTVKSTSYPLPSPTYFETDFQ